MNQKNLLFAFTAFGVACACTAYVAGSSAPSPEQKAEEVPAVEKTMQKLAPGVELRGALSYSEDWEDSFPYGIYTVGTEEGVDPEFVFLTEDRNMEGGAVYVDGVIHAISKVGEWLWDDEDEGWYFNQKGAAFTTFDAETGEVLFDTTEGMSSDMFANDLCYDATTGNVYGCFKVKGYQPAWGIFDVDTRTVKYINEKMSSSMSAIAADENGVIYGVATNGDLVTIDKETGKVSAPLASFKKYNGWKSSGVIDPSTHTFYWLLQSYGEGGVYAIDLTSYEITKLYTCKHNERWGGAYLATATADEGAPASATDLTLSFPKGALTGSLTFTAPAVDADDEDISGTTLNYVVKSDDTQVAKGTVVAGKSVTTSNFTVTAGNHDITVTLSNDKGESIPAVIRNWFGKDAPDAVTNLQVSKDDMTVNLSWTAPAQSLHNGYYEPSEVTYKITRLPDNKVVAENVKDTKYADAISSKTVTKYYYEVTPYYSGLEGKTVKSEGVIVGNGVNLPYETNFSDEDCELMTVEDTNGDGNTWLLGNENAMYRFGDVDGDDWVFLAPFYLEGGIAYCLQADIQSGMGRLEKYEIKVGNAPKSSAMSQAVIEPTEFEEKYHNAEAFFSVPETGTYYIGIHALSPQGHFSLIFNSVKLEVKMSDEAPAAGELKAEAGAKGALSTTLTITAPTKKFNGENLDELEGANLFHNGKIAESFDDVKPGQTFTYTHEGSNQGENTYSIVFVNEHGNGLSTETTLFVGQDVPLAPKNVKLSFNGNEAVVTWEAPGTVGVNGGYVDPEGVTYSPAYTDAGEWILLEETNECQASMQYDKTGKQRWYLMGVMAANKQGVSDAGYSNPLIVGDPYAMPYEESLDNGVNKSLFASTSVLAPIGGLGSDTELTASGVGGCLKFTPYSMFYEAPYIDTITTGIINTTGYTSDPVTLSFWYYNDAAENDGDELSAALYDQDNDVTYNLGSVKLDGKATEWREFKAEKMIAATNIRIHIGVKSINGNTIYLDDFKLTGINGVAQVCGDSVSVAAGKGEILISGLTGENVTVATVNGLTLYNGEGQGDLNIEATPGIYMVRVADRSFKLVIK